MVDTITWYPIWRYWVKVWWPRKKIYSPPSPKRNKFLTAKLCYPGMQYTDCLMKTLFTSKHTVEVNCFKPMIENCSSRYWIQTMFNYKNTVRIETLIGIHGRFRHWYIQAGIQPLIRCTDSQVLASKPESKSYLFRLKRPNWSPKSMDLHVFPWVLVLPGIASYPWQTF